MPQTAPSSDHDPRVPAYQVNVLQISQGGRYFAWYGCSTCHGDAHSGVLNLADGHWKHGGGFAQVFASIRDRHARLAYGPRIPTEQLWQLSAYVRDLPKHQPEKRARLDADQTGEAQGSAWRGPQ